MKAKQLLYSYASGNHSSIINDNCDDINSIKQYQSGDKKLDIKNSIKYQQTMAYSFNPEKQLDVYLLLDMSGSMGQPDKLEMSTLVSLFIVFLAEHNGENLNIINFGKNMHHYASCDYSDAVYLISNLQPDGEECLSLGLFNLYNSSPDNALIFIVSDYLLDMSVMSNKFKHLSTHNLVYSILIDEFIQNATLDIVDGENNTMIYGSVDKKKYELNKQNILLFLRSVGCNPIIITSTDKNPLLPLIKKLL